MIAYVFLLSIFDAFMAHIAWYSEKLEDKAAQFYSKTQFSKNKATNKLKYILI